MGSSHCRVLAAVLLVQLFRKDTNVFASRTYIRIVGAVGAVGAVGDCNAVSGSFAFEALLRRPGEEVLRAIYIYKCGRRWDLGFVTGTIQPSPLAELRRCRAGFMVGEPSAGPRSPLHTELVASRNYS